MSEYRVRVATGSFLGSGTWDKVSVSLVGAAGESPALRLDNFGKDFRRGAEEDFEVTAPQDVGEVLLLRVHKAPLVLPRPLGPLAPDAWFCRWFQVTPPGGAPLHFPCYQWLEGEDSLVLRPGAAKVIWQDSHPLLLAQRQAEIKERQQKYRWSEFFPGIPRCLDAENLKELDPNLRYSVSKEVAQKSLLVYPNIALALKALLTSQRPWRSLDEIQQTFIFPKSPTSEYTFEHWQEDAFFAYQFLNGSNPVLIRRCRCLPENFPVTDAMVAPVLGPGTSLQAELESGSLYLVDHAILSGLHPRAIDGQPQFTAAPLTLLYQCPDGTLLPLAIQLLQMPGPDNPIFLPSDTADDWLLAKTWVRHSDFLVHEMFTHLLLTHFEVETFSLSLLRQLPMCHPIFKLLLPHFRYTFHINILARTGLFAPGKLIDQLADRDVHDLCQYYYRDDALQIWAAIESFVSDIVGIYYPDDSAVSRDSELQAWVMENFQEGFLSRVSSGVPSALDSCTGLIEYLTMIIFNCSAQHSAVNSGQFEFSAWMPNTPTTMRLPPPAAKGQADLVASLPKVNTTCHALVLFWGVSHETEDTRRLGTYPDQHFTEEAPKQSIVAFQSRLAQISHDIQERNQGLVLPYTYLDPAVVENSVTV
ncbi:polyunsaturated fatty acid lipoxygenase ALOX15B-like isoform X2 [Erinaceus europaeus]|uniref:Polyunsaturated fatty acid lipoxygenase ALOX15B-like isoform X2 n=1 Tax=Erinaceus europaeus TaxID=9365 RepID=A0ABM3YH03_ERIEU|nr:polyunsaturated fatty acid lipoxygenase ALOX15B-like isoform X2 [Erinaceus europaeus]